jgi:hypothetical protein
VRERTQSICGNWIKQVLLISHENYYYSCCNRLQGFLERR